jgi:hypothetical protein
MSSEDIQAVIQIVNGTLSNNKEEREQAVSKLEELRKNSIALIYCLFKILHGNINFLNIRNK